MQMISVPYPGAIRIVCINGDLHGRKKDGYDLRRSSHPTIDLVSVFAERPLTLALSPAAGARGQDVLRTVLARNELHTRRER